MESKLPLSQSDIARLNIGKRRGIHLGESRDDNSKKNKNCGNPYQGRNGDFHPGILPPDQAKVCGNCSKFGCNLDLEVKLQLFNQYYKLNYDDQSNVLVSSVAIEEPKNRSIDAANSKKQHTYKYSIVVNGRRLEVCKAGFMDIYKVTSSRLRTIAAKMDNGILCAKDGRGSHLNRPNRKSEEVKQQVRAHINLFPTYETHYARKVGNPLRKYLSPDLNLAKMHNLYNEYAVENDLQQCEFWLYGHIFQTEFELRIGSPKVDTCDTCDKYKAQLLDADETKRILIKSELACHHSNSTCTYLSYKEDGEMARLDPNFVVLTMDLEQVMFSPALGNISSFYLKKMSNYNLGVHNARDNTGTMYNWDETTARQGSNEVSSCLWTYCTTKFMPLQDGEERELTVWFDRCRGQNNNFIVLTTMLTLVWKKYFSKVNQKFFLTGHSYNDCDRDFGLIEKQQRVNPIMVPRDIEKIIRAARTVNPFDVVWMRKNNFKDYKFQSTLIRRPDTLKITKFLWFQYDRQMPYQLLTRFTHSQDIWQQHILYGLTGERIDQVPEHMIGQFRNAYDTTILMDVGKKNDLRKLLEFLSGENRTFYEYLLIDGTRWSIWTAGR